MTLQDLKEALREEKWEAELATHYLLLGFFVGTLTTAGVLIIFAALY